MKNRLAELLERYLQNQASDEDAAQLHAFLSDYKEEEVDVVINELLQKTTIPEMKEDSAERIRDYIFEKGKKHEKTKVVSFQRSWTMAAAAAIVILSTVGGFWLYQDKIGFETKIALSEAVSVTGPEYVRLPDNSTVTLKKGSKLTYERSFGSAERNVTLEGEGFFDVAHDPSKPFKVYTGKVVTTVLGTAFDINASEPEKITVTVTRGKVSVGDDNKVYDQLTPDEQLTVNTTDYKFEKKIVNAEEVIAWKKDYLILDKVTLEKAAEIISERYNVKVTIANDQIKNCIISGWFINNESLEEVLALVTGLRKATYSIEGDNVTITGGTSCQEENKSDVSVLPKPTTI